jgi:hypothetical protein
VLGYARDLDAPLERDLRGLASGISRQSSRSPCNLCTSAANSGRRDRMTVNRGRTLENKKKELFHKQESLSDMAGRAASHKEVLRRPPYER